MRDLKRSARIDEVGHADRHAGGAGQDKLSRILASHDTADTVDGDIDGLGNLPDHAHGDVVAQRARKAALGLGHAGLAGMDVDGHALDGVDDRKAVGAGSLEGLAISATLTGAIFTNSGLSVTLRQAAITEEAPSGVEPMAAPPAAILGQLTLIS